MKAIFGFVALLVSGACTLHGEDAPATDKSIRALVRNSTLIIDADIVQPNLYGSVDEFIASYSVIVRVRNTFLGQAPAPELWVRVAGLPLDFRSQPTLLKTRQRCLFFLRPDQNGSTGFLGVASFASAQRYHPELISAVQRLTGSK